MLKPIFCLLLSLSSLAAMADSAKDQQVTELSQKAIKLIKGQGIESACKQFADPSAGFIRGELFVYVHDIHAKMICHAVNPRLNGKDMIDLKDVDGKYFNREMLKIATAGEGHGWINYQFVNPVSKKIQPKTSYIERIDGYIVGVGYFKD